MMRVCGKRPTVFSERRNRFWKWRAMSHCLPVEEFRNRTSRIQEKMAHTEVPKEIKKAVEKAEKEAIPKMLEYERNFAIMMRMPRSCV